MMRLRTSFLLLAVCAIALSVAHARDLTFEDRVAAQEAIDRVYYSHQIGATRSFEEALPRAALQRKVTTYLEQSAALEQFWKTPVTANMLDRELKRMADETMMPERLRELFEALGNDSFLIQECLARPALVSRLTQSFYEHDSRLHFVEASEAWELRQTLTDLLPGLNSSSVTAVASPDVAIPVDLGQPDRAFDPDSLGGEGARDPCAPDDTWENGSLDKLPEARKYHSAVWTGSEMIVWGGYQGDFSPAAYLDSGGRYDPATDSWTPTSTAGAPSKRSGHTAVWTGSRMVVWGGHDGSIRFDTGGQYDPATDSWTVTSTTGAPPASRAHEAVWTGSKMLVWGGYDAGYLGTGGVYDPEADSWTAISTVDAPSGRHNHRAVWTGSEMLVWGGFDGSYIGDGGRYDPATDSWTAMSMVDAPSARSGHAAVWTGSLMVVWGGRDPHWTSSGGRYDPVTDSWAPMSGYGGARADRMVWTGSEMIVWGGQWLTPTTFYDSGGRYDPVADSWTATTTDNAPSGRAYYEAVWTGEHMILWGGSANYELDTGGRYDPVTDSWTPTSTMGAPKGRYGHKAVWTGNWMVISGGRGESFQSTPFSKMYDPALDTWTGIPGTSTRYYHSLVWTGDEVIRWGGGYHEQYDQYFNDGERFNPLTRIRTVTSKDGAPSPRWYHTAVWTGSEMVIWGGREEYKSRAIDGGRYDPATDSWAPVSTVGAPQYQEQHSAVWTGSLMVTWGGSSNGGGRYDPVTDSWSSITTVGEPLGFYGHQSLWTGSRMLVWGGYDGGTRDSGGQYDPVADSWTATSTVGAPEGRASFSAAWTGEEMIVWGGKADDDDLLDSGGRYNPVTDSWVPTSTAEAPTPRSEPTAVWTGSWMVVWGGRNSGLLSTGGRYALGHAIDNDSDGYTECDGDCNDDHPQVYFGAPEINDGVDNQCPGEVGSGMRDEIAGTSGFRNPDQKKEFSWDPQPGATSYQLVSCMTPEFTGYCYSWILSGTSYVDGGSPGYGGVFYYLVRAYEPYAGSWGTNSEGQERDVYP